MLLENKTVVIYGAGGAVGETVARAFRGLEFITHVIEEDGVI